MKLVLKVLILWLPFSLAVLLAVPVSFVAIFAAEQYAHQLLKAMDKVMAALLGNSGLYTVSAEGGVAEPKCGFCAWVCRNVLEHIQPGHCAGAAQREGLR